MDEVDNIIATQFFRLNQKESAASVIQFAHYSFSCNSVGILSVTGRYMPKVILKNQSNY